MMGAAKDLLEALLKCLLAVLQHLGEGIACTRQRAAEACMSMTDVWEENPSRASEGWILPVEERQRCNNHRTVL